jgi:hypothetical protein
MNETHEMERDRGRVLVLATLAVVAIVILSQVAYTPALPFSPPLDATPVDGALRPKLKLPLIKRINPFRKREPDEYPQAYSREVQAPGS